MPCLAACPACSDYCLVTTIFWPCPKVVTISDNQCTSDVSKSAPLIFLTQVSKICPYFWTHFGHIICVLRSDSKYVQTYDLGLDAFWTQHAYLDTFWTYIGRINVLDTLTIGFGHILDMFWTILLILCPKYVHTRIVN